VLPVSPSTWHGLPLSDDADVFALDVTDFGAASIVARLSGGPQSLLGGPRLLLSTIPVSLDQSAKSFAAPVLADGGGDSAPVGGVGVPSVAVVDGGTKATSRIAFASAETVRVVTDDDNGTSAAPPLGPAAGADAKVVTAVNPNGGGVTAWNATGADGQPGIGIRQDLADGEAQSGTVAGAQAGPVSDLSIGRTSSGDAIVAWLQGDPGRYEVVADRVSSPPSALTVTTPDGWVRPRSAWVRWNPVASSVGGVRYDVVLDGKVAATALTVRQLRPSADLLGSGARSVQVLATDASGQQVLSSRERLRVDARPPRATVRFVANASRGRPRSKRGRASAKRSASTSHSRAGGASRAARARGRSVEVRVSDSESGVAAARTTWLFGDGTRSVRGKKRARHTYERAGRYTITVRARDKVGNATTLRMAVRLK
jgi:hypothetical protein